MNVYEIRHLETDDKLESFVAFWDHNLESRLNDLANRLMQGKSLHAIGLTGPSCSGKTTAACKLTDCLQAHGQHVYVISIDDFYFDKEYLHKRAEADPNIEIDYDSEDTIDIGFFEQKTRELLSCHPTRLPHFDFKSGLRTEGQLIVPKETDVFLFEGIQVLYPRVDAVLRQSKDYCNIYISPASALQAGEITFSPNEIRLMRRVVRDCLKRATNPAFTLYLWQSVRENEEKHIFPYADCCDYKIDSTMPYEIGMLKPYLEQALATVLPTDRFYGVALQLLHKIERIQVIPSAYMTQNSLYKEFIP